MVSISTSARLNIILRKEKINSRGGYAIATGKAEFDPSADLRGALTPVKHGHMATIVNPKKMGELFKAIDGYEG